MHHNRKNHNGILVYIAGPVHGSGNVEDNVTRALDAAERLYQAGFTPFVPHLFTHWEREHGSGGDGQEKFMAMDLEWLSRCDVMIRLPGVSPGADREVAFAEEHGIPVYQNDNVPNIKWHSPIDRVVADFRAGKLSHLGYSVNGYTRGGELRKNIGTAFLALARGKITLNGVQEEVSKWLRRQPFGEQKGWEPLLGIVEEVGELSHAYLKMTQGIRGSKREHEQKLADAVGDILIYLAGFCEANGIILEEAFFDAWKEVSGRDWAKFPKNGKTA